MIEFVDTNILLYAHGINSAKNPEKVKLAIEFMKTKWNDLFLTWQVLIEFGANLAKKSNLSLEECTTLVRRYAVLLDADAPNNPEQIETALRLAAENKLSYWDANLIAAVAAQGGTILYSEDMASGSIYCGVKIVNPFQKVLQENTTF